MSYAHQARPAHRDRPHRWRRPLAVAAAVATALTGITGLAGGTAAAVVDDDRGTTTSTTAATATTAAIPDLTSANRRAPIAGLPDWSRSGYRGGAALPGPAEAHPDAACHITAQELASQYGVRADGGDATTGLQRAVDALRSGCTPSAGYTRLSSITLPAGRIVVTRQLALDADYMVLRGAGMRQTTLAFRPAADTRYDTLTPDGSDWDEDGMTHGAGKGGWTWPGRGLLRVQTREVSPKYASDHASAPANRKDLFEGSANQHWASGVPLREGSSIGSTQIKLAADADMSRFKAGAHLWVGAANTAKFYQQQTIHDSSTYVNLHMRQQIFQIASVDSTGRNLTLDKPLEYDLPLNSTSDGSAAIGGTVYPSRVTPLKVVQGVGIEDLSITQELDGMPKLAGGTYDVSPADATTDFGNIAPEYAQHGIVLKWAANVWIRRVATHMTGSHAVVTESAKNIQVQESSFDGSWNKGKGGNGYFRGSRVWDSLYAYNTSRNLRHFTFQWSASDNVVIGNDFDSDLNLHGGWERRNLFESNKAAVPFENSSKNCRANCGEEGGGGPDDSTWWPIWWGAGPKAVKWSGATGPQNVFYGNDLSKQTTAGGGYQPYYADRRRVYQLGSAASNPATYQHLAENGSTIPDWAGRETLDYSRAPHAGVNATKTDASGSLFLKSTGSGPGGGTVVDVSTAAQLRSALADAQPGQTIRMAAGEYRGSFVTQKAGTASAPITLTGPSDAVLVNDGPSGTAPSCPAPTSGWDSGYGLWLYGAPYWNLNGFTVKEAKKGVVLDDSHHVTIDGLSVHHVDEEAVHFRRSSADGVIKNSTITHTGLVQAGYGEAVYIGSAGSNWGCHGNQGGVDRSDRVQVLDNRIGPSVAAEHIDIKEGTSGGVIRGNTFDGAGISGSNSADSWVDAKGVGYLIENNTGTFSSPGTFANGYETHNPSTTPSFPNGCGNVWRGNRSDLGGAGAYAIKITSTSKCTADPNVVYASNTVTNAGSGLTNVPVTP
ncbi:right-handed parallel beta-helix repeat-containing protein [Streptomyces sp. NBC_01077]|uniref:peptide ABC transporter substrate-binding protein n=1 Tax=Streptomyces sp. NBC_01077 TaxID=2903746 RepID=UPI00386FACB0|nr:right-handed parallel beta-helix repeat-containing protein [Streptomyces sp. NBC_01077]